ncbi:hypothetical protein BDZ97DRAFT_783635 [Flammula alnicola]|nr:hypothetical protein BDZ97DRAFT_783635 [Flammula alnicola]
MRMFGRRPSPSPGPRWEALQEPATDSSQEEFEWTMMMKRQLVPKSRGQSMHSRLLKERIATGLGALSQPQSVPGMNKLWDKVREWKVLLQLEVYQRGPARRFASFVFRSSQAGPSRSRIPYRLPTPTPAFRLAQVCLHLLRLCHRHQIRHAAQKNNQCARQKRQEWLLLRRHESHPQYTEGIFPAHCLVTCSPDRLHRKKMVHLRAKSLFRPELKMNPLLHSYSYQTQITYQ